MTALRSAFDPASADAAETESPSSETSLATQVGA